MFFFIDFSDESGKFVDYFLFDVPVSESKVLFNSQFAFLTLGVFWPCHREMLFLQFFCRMLVHYRLCSELKRWSCAIKWVIALVVSTVSILIIFVRSGKKRLLLWKWLTIHALEKVWSWKLRCSSVDVIALTIFLIFIISGIIIDDAKLIFGERVGCDGRGNLIIIRTLFAILGVANLQIFCKFLLVGHELGFFHLIKSHGLAHQYSLTSIFISICLLVSLQQQFISLFYLPFDSFQVDQFSLFSFFFRVFSWFLFTLKSFLWF